jgi:hypothetical protein
MTDEHDALVAELGKEREIASVGNTSDYHKKRFESLKKEVASGTPKPKKEAPPAKEPETKIESTASNSTNTNVTDNGTS